MNCPKMHINGRYKHDKSYQLPLKCISIAPIRQIACYSARQTLRVVIATVYEHTSNLEIKNKIGYLNYFSTGCR